MSLYLNLKLFDEFTIENNIQLLHLTAAEPD
jgi:hypothetical protein